MLLVEILGYATSDLRQGASHHLAKVALDSKISLI